MNNVFYSAEFLMRNAPMRINKFSRGHKRQVLTWDGKRHMYSHVMWDFLYPNNRRKKGEVIHHIDGDTLNDMPDNLQKMTNTEHSRFHATEQSQISSVRTKNQHLDKTHCKSGHSLSGGNVSLRIRKYGDKIVYCRVCLACKRVDNNRRYKARKSP